MHKIVLYFRAIGLYKKINNSFDFTLLLNFTHCENFTHFYTHRSVCPLLAAVLACPPPEVRRLPRALHVDAVDENDN